MTRVVFAFCMLLSPLVKVTASLPGYGFIENKSQWPCEVEFLADIAGGKMAIQAGRFNYFFLDYQRINELHEYHHKGFKEVDIAKDNVQITGRKVSVQFAGSNAHATAMASRKSTTYFNYFFGDDPNQWASKAFGYSEVRYNGIYDKIDLKLSTAGANIKYDLLVAPGGDPQLIQIEYDGAASLSLVHDDLVVDAGLAQIVEKKPVAYQQMEGKRYMIAIEYQLIGNKLSFIFPNGYDPCIELVIDPLLIFSTYSGSSADNWGSTATPGENGNVYSAGVTNHFAGQVFSGTFPATPGAFQVNYSGIYDVAILKYDSAGQHLLYASYLGGADSESPHSLVVNSNDELLVLGTTSSDNFPTTSGAFDQSYNDGAGASIQHVVPYNHGADIFAAKISKNGAQLMASTFLGGTGSDGLNPSSGALALNYGDQLRGDIITDENNDIYISTVASSPDFPVINGIDLNYNGGATDALVIKISNDLSQLLWASFLGGAGEDAAYTIKLDSEGKLWVAGGTTSSNFPTTVGVHQPTQPGFVDGWIAHLENDGSSLIASTYTGTPTYNQVYFLDLNESDEVYVYGQTTGSFPITPGVYSNPNSGQFLQKFSKDLSTLLMSTVFGSGRGAPDISPTAFLVNDCNNIYMTGWGGYVNTLANKPLLAGSSTLGMPTTEDAYQSSTSGSDFYFIVLTEDGNEFLYGTFMGGNLSKTHVDGGTSRFDKSGIVYHAVCSGCGSGNTAGGGTSDFPTTPNAWSNTNNSVNCNNAAFKFDLSSLRARIVTNSIELDNPGLTMVCLPDQIVFQNKSTGGEVYEWDFGDGTSETKPDTTAIIHQYQQKGTYLVKLRAIDQGTCVGEDIDYANIYVNEASGFSDEDKTICHGSSIQLVAGGGTIYEWRIGQDSLVANSAKPIFSPDDTTSYFLAVTDANGCLFLDTVDINVVPRIDLQFEAKKVTDCNSRAAIQLTNHTTTDEELHFDFGDGGSSDQQHVMHTYEEDGIYRIRLVGKREFCVFEETIELPFFTIKVPNVITPQNSDVNSAGKNDTFKILYGEAFGSPTTFEMGLQVCLSVYNRWGKLVYVNKKYDDTWAGEGLETGTYFYEVEIENEPTCKGWVQIIR